MLTSYRKGSRKPSEKGQTLVNNVKHPIEPGIIWLLSDVKKLCQNQLHKSQDNRRLAYIQFDVPRIMKFPQTAIVWGCVSSEGDVLLSHIFGQGLGLNSDGYVELLNTMIKPCLETLAVGRSCVVTRFSSLAHLK